MPFYLDAADPDMAFVYVQNPTGGVFAGDRLLTSVTADAGARVHLTTQSATKLYRMDGGEARQELRFELAPGAYVENMPDAADPAGRHPLPPAHSSSSWPPVRPSSAPRRSRPGAALTASASPTTCWS